MRKEPTKAVRSSAWLGELEAALKSAVEWEAWAKQHEQRDIELCFGFAAWRARKTLDSERRHSPNDPKSATEAAEKKL